MCRGCWESEGQPDEWTPQIGRFLELYRRLYELEPAGGPLHSVLDDWNVDDVFLHPIYEYPARPQFGVPAVPDRYSSQVHAICDELAELLTAMTVPQRYAALAYAEGFLTPPDREEVSRP